MGGVSENPYEPPLTPPESEPSKLLLFLGKLFPDLSKAVPGPAEVLWFLVCMTLGLIWFAFFR
jgi:hypothetical protein